MTKHWSDWNWRRELTSLEKHEVIRRLTKMDRSQIEDAFTYHAPSKEQVDDMLEIREKAKELAYLLINKCPPCADRSSVLRRLRNVVMEANASIILNGLV